MSCRWAWLDIIFLSHCQRLIKLYIKILQEYITILQELMVCRDKPLILAIILCYLVSPFHIIGQHTGFFFFFFFFFFNSHFNYIAYYYYYCSFTSTHLTSRLVSFASCICDFHHLKFSWSWLHSIPAICIHILVSFIQESSILFSSCHWPRVMLRIKS